MQTAKSQITAQPVQQATRSRVESEPSKLLRWPLSLLRRAMNGWSLLQSDNEDGERGGVFGGSVWIKIVYSGLRYSSRDRENVCGRRELLNCRLQYCMDTDDHDDGIIIIMALEMGSPNPVTYIGWSSSASQPANQPTKPIPATIHLIHLLLCVNRFN